MKIICFGTDKDTEAVLLENLPSDIDMTCYEEKLEMDNIDKARDAEILTVFVSSEVNKEIIDAIPTLKLIATQSTGFDHIDTAYAKEKGITVCSVPGYGSYSVAEHTFALMLTVSRKIFDAYHQVREDGDFRIKELQGFDLVGKTLGVVGVGKIGKNVVRIAKGFGMNVIASDPYPDEEFAKETGIKYMTFKELLEQSDIVTFHAPYMKETHHMLNKEMIGYMKKGAYVINAARGGLIDTSAFVEALQSGYIAGAGLDVLEEERELKEEAELTSGDLAINELKTLIQDHILIDMPNVVITPHIGSHSIESDMARFKITAENIKAFMDGKPQNVVEIK
ncbi:MAG: NAD(P)-dependent oxidoreductase [Parcubacteria group bacterium]